MGDRSPKQCHKSITEELINGPLVPMHSIERQFKELLQQGMHVFGTKTFGNRGGVCQVTEQHCHLFAFAFESTSRGQNLLGKVFRRVREWLSFLVWGWVSSRS